MLMCIWCVYICILLHVFIQHFPFQKSTSIHMLQNFLPVFYIEDILNDFNTLGNDGELLSMFTCMHALYQPFCVVFTLLL